MSSQYPFYVHFISILYQPPMSILPSFYIDFISFLYYNHIKIKRKEKKSMPKIQLDLPEDVYKKLKEEAKNNYQSVKGYVTNSLVKQMRGQVIDTSLIPENTTIKTTTTRPLTQEERLEQQKQKFLDLCKEMYGEKFYKEYAPDIVHEYLSIMPGDKYEEFAEEPPEGKYVRAVYTMPVDKQREYIAEMKHYLEEG